MAPPDIVDLKGSSPAGKGEAKKAVQPRGQQTLSFTERAVLEQVLENEVRNLQPERLREVVLTAFRKSQQVVEVFQSLLLVSEDDVATEKNESEDEEEEAESSKEEKHSNDENASGASGEEESMPSFTEHRRYPSQEVIKNLEFKGQVALERYMAQFKHRRTGNQMVDDFNGISKEAERQVAAKPAVETWDSNSSHKRNLSAYSNMPKQADLKKPALRRQWQDMQGARFAKVL